MGALTVSIGFGFYSTTIIQGLKGKAVLGVYFCITNT